MYYVNDDDLPPAYAECVKCQRLYFNALQCPNCNEVNVNVRPNFYVNANHKKNVSFKCQLQAGEEEMEVVTQKSSIEEYPLLHTIDANPGILTEHDNGHTGTLNDHLFSSSAELSSFLQRPVLIQSFTWSEGAGIDQTFNPWYNYLNTAVIKNKIQNYFYASMKLHLKIMINASPFYYGLAIASYQPVSGTDPAAINSTDATCRMTALSQRPHVFLYPQTSQGGSLELPFVYYYDAIDITNAVAVQNLGALTIKSVVDLDNANSIAGTGATIRVYAYASDVRLGGPTNKAVLQSGVISGPASAVANIAKSIENVPVIGKFAKATAIGAKAVAGIASIFGFTDVPVIRDVEALKNLPFHSLTSAHIGEPVTKLSLDPKNEVSIDSSIIGTSTDDELAISNFVNRYAIMGVATWSAASTPDALLWSARVMPMSFNSLYRGSAALGYIYQTIPMGLVSHLYNYWRGGITYKITAIASKFHRGRYVVSWDPTGDISAVQSYIGTCYSKVIDIAEETEIEITIPYMQQAPFCKTTFNIANTSQASTYLSNISQVSNGVLTIRVFTQQTSPVATADIKLIIAVKGADDLEFALPKTINQNLSPFAFQSDEMLTDTRTVSSLTNDNKLMDRQRYLVSFGEAQKSLRTLMRRATLCYSDVIPYPTTAADTIVSFIANRSCYPVAPGFDPNGVGLALNASAVATPYNWVNYSPVDFITQCFAARRGSIMHHLNLNAGKTPMGYLSASFSVNTRTAGLWNGSSSNTSASSVNQLTKTVLGILDNGASGCDMTSGFVMPAMSVQVPHNTPATFMVTNPKYSVLGLSTDYTDVMTLKFLFTTRDAALTQVVDYIEIGTDFSVGMFLNVPTLYYVATLPTAAP